MYGGISNFGQVSYIRRYTLTDGAEAGLRVVEVNNGVLRFMLNESKALDIMQLWQGGTNISFLSKNGFTAREIPFVRRFEGGMMYTCGLDSVGGRDGYELHGNMHNTPAKVTRLECGEKEIVVEAEMRDTALFGQNYLLKRRVTTAVGSDSVTVEDELVNDGGTDGEYCLLYHVNLGYPMLDEGVYLDESESGKVESTPRTPWAAENSKDRTVITPPEIAREETCYFLKLANPVLSVVNEKLGKKFTIRYSKDTLPCFVEWKSMATGDYALGLEPCSTELDDHFRYTPIKAGEKKHFKVTLKVSDL